MTQWHIAIKEIRRNGLRSLLIAVSVCTAAAVLTAAVLLIIGINQGISHTVKRLGADLMVIPRGEKIAREFNDALITGRPATFYLEPSIAGDVSRMPDVVGVSAQTFAETLTNARCCAGEFFIVGFDPESDFTISPWLKKDLPTWSSGHHNWALVGDRILLREGGTIQLYGTCFTVAGVLEPTSTGMDWTVYVPDRVLRKMVSDSRIRAEAPLRISEGAVSAVFVKAAREADLIDLAERIEQAHPDVQAILSSSVAKLARGQMSTIAGVLVCVVIGLWGMALFLNGAVFFQAVRERQSEIGLLMAKGAERSFVFGILARESGAIAASSSAVGCTFGVLIVTSFRELLADALGTPDVHGAVGVTIILVVAFVALGTTGGVIAALLPVQPMLKAEPYEAIKRGRTT
ncbi:MAG: ABC transporter permease [Planctomycetota bacterium]|jgi:putative ABC transport system permease protein